VLIARFFVLSCIVLCSGHMVIAQTLVPRAYVITPTNANAITLSWSYLDGGLDVGGVIFKDITGRYHVSAISYYHAFGLFGRSANVTALLPYGVGTFQSSSVLGNQRVSYLSGLFDVPLRFSVNLKGGPAMGVRRFATWKQRVLLGASLTVLAPTGQYDPARPINWGVNRWGFKPELGYSQRWGRWVLDGYGGVWFYTKNSASYSILSTQSQTQNPIGSFEGHLSYDFRRHCWVSLDGNFWFGGTISSNGMPNPATRQTSSRIGGTFSFPLRKHQSVKISYSNGTYVRFGDNHQTVSVGWQYSWIGWPKFHSQ
jgi:Putative MetA-pathway of phenol degradation